MDLVGDDENQVLDACFDAPTADDALDASQSRAWLRKCLEELRPQERQALVLAYHHGLSHSDLARHLEKPLGTVKAWVRRAIDSLRVCIENCSGAAR